MGRLPDCQACSGKENIEAGLKFMKEKWEAFAAMSIQLFFLDESWIPIMRRRNGPVH